MFDFLSRNRSRWMTAPDVTLIVVSALVIILLATLYPSRKAAGVQPAEALSYE